MPDAYDADAAPDPEEWLALDESERVELILAYHRELVATHPPTPNPRVHAVFHAIVENQVVLGDKLPVQATLERLMAEGLSRHEAVHAIGSVLAGLMYDLGHGEPPEGDVNEIYSRELGSLSAESWRQRASEGEE